MAEPVVKCTSDSVKAAKTAHPITEFLPVSILDTLAPLAPLCSLVVCIFLTVSCCTGFLWVGLLEQQVNSIVYASLVWTSRCMLTAFILYVGWYILVDTCAWEGGRTWTIFTLEQCNNLSQFCIRLFNHAFHPEGMTRYFNIQLKRQVPLDPSQGPYLLVIHPHGVYGASHMTHFASTATGFNSLFPGLKMHLVTLNVNFWIPLWREILLFKGFISADKRAIQSTLSQPHHAVGIVPGGAKESLLALPGHNTLLLSKRKGFIKMALQTGQVVQFLLIPRASLVPVYAFGENNLYYQIRHPIVSKFQALFTRAFSFAPVTPIGRWGTLIPFRTRITTVGKFVLLYNLHLVGTPIPVEKTPHPTAKQLDALHEEYIQQLNNLFNKYKDQYDPARTQDLIIL